MSPGEIGTMGEGIVHNLLPGSDWVNEEHERQLPYDVVWDGVKIDVKTTLMKEPRRLHHSFVVGVSPKHNGIVLVFVALGKNENFFWADKYSKEVKRSRHTSMAIPLSELPMAIKNVAAMEVPIITELDTSRIKQLKGVNLYPVDHLRLEAIADKMTEINRTQYSRAHYPRTTKREANSIIIEGAAIRLGIHIDDPDEK